MHRLLGTRKIIISKRIYARALREDKNSRIELAIILDDETTAEDLRKAWPAIEMVRKQIIDHQGTDLSEFRNNIRAHYTAMHLLEGFSYAEIAMDINYNSLCNLIQFVHAMNSSDIESVYEFYHVVIDRFKGLGMKKEEIGDWMKLGVEEIKQGRPPWSLTNGPVTRQRVLDAIRQLKREINSGKFVLKKPEVSGPEIKKIRLGELSKINQPIWDEAERLLRQLPESGGLDRLEAVYRRHFSSGVENSG